VPPKFFVEARQSLNMSRPAFARSLHIPERTLEKWEQGRSKPNQEAIVLVELVKEEPKMLQRIQRAYAKAAAAGR
jgi:putative transcriptional regulator